MPLHTKRVYEPLTPGDGYRVLVDRMWPRGITRERAAIDEWARDLAPSDGYRADAALCGTHRTLLRELREFELDMHHHVHEENNVLFPRVLDRLGDA